jgi:tetratricopeptide (TPR) repeat protein
MIGGCMRELPLSEKRRLDAAEGWGMLGSPQEAIEELEKLNPQFRLHPEVLAIRWQIYMQAGWFESAWAVSDILCRMMPHNPHAWACQANSLRAFKGVRAAYDLLARVAPRFSSEPAVSYNLGCFSCQLGQYEEACRWLIRAFDMDNSVDFKMTALLDPDLKPLWTKIELFPGLLANKKEEPEESRQVVESRQ